MTTSCPRDSLIVTVMVAVLAGCGSGEAASVPYVSPVRGTSLEAGGAFTAQYSGTYSQSVACVYFGSKQHDGHVAFSGSGSASFAVLDPSTETINMTDDHKDRCLDEYSGLAILKSTLHPKSTIGLDLGEGGECGKHTFAVGFGTGRFSHAMGSGTLTINCNGTNRYGTYTDQWTGTITY